MANATIYVATTGSDSTGDGSSGNPYATPGKAGSAITGTGNTIRIKAGTYTQSSGTANVAGGYLDPPAGAATAPNIIEGYNSTPGDLDAVNDWSNFPTIKAYSGTTTLMRNTNNHTIVRNLIMDGNAQAVYGFYVPGSFNRIVNSKVVNCTTYGLYLTGTRQIAFRVWASGCANGFAPGGAGIVLVACIATACTAAGYLITASAYTTLLRCLAYGNTGASTDGFNDQSGNINTYDGCVAYNNGRDGIRYQSAVPIIPIIHNCFLVSNLGCGIRSDTNVFPEALIDYNAFRGNTSGPYSGFSPLNYGAGTLFGPHDINLSGDPFTNAAAGNFSLNSTAGAGGAARAAGFPGVFPGGLTTGYLDIGAAQHQDTGGGGGGTTNYIINRITNMYLNEGWEG